MFDKNVIRQFINKPSYDRFAQMRTYNKGEVAGICRIFASRRPDAFSCPGCPFCFFYDDWYKCLASGLTSDREAKKIFKKHAGEILLASIELLAILDNGS